jgi:hypothetical protein
MMPHNVHRRLAEVAPSRHQFMPTATCASASLHGWLRSSRWGLKHMPILSPPGFTPAQNCFASVVHAFLIAVPALTRAVLQGSERSLKCFSTQALTRPSPGCTLAHCALTSIAQAFDAVLSCAIALALESNKTTAIVTAVLNTRSPVSIVTIEVALNYQIFRESVPNLCSRGVTRFRPARRISQMSQEIMGRQAEGLFGIVGTTVVTAAR